MTVNKRVRVIILNYNRAELTRACVSSVLGQNYSPVDIVIVDNNSSDEEVKKLKDIKTENVSIVFCRENLGYARGNNEGIKYNLLAEPDYVLILNNDVILCDPLTIRKLIDCLEVEEQRVACSPLVNTCSNPRKVEAQLQVRRVPDFLTVFSQSNFLIRRVGIFKTKYNYYIYKDKMPFTLGTEIECETINGSCFLIKKEFLNLIGFFDTGTFLYFEEIILGWQIKNSCKVAYLVTNTAVEHEQGATTGSKKGKIKYFYFLENLKSEIYYCRRFLKASDVMIGLLIISRLFDYCTKKAADLFFRGGV